MKARLGLGAAVIAVLAILACGLTVYGATQMSARVNTAVEAEQRMQRFSVLASQIGSFIVVVFEVAQSGADVETMTIRLDGLTSAITQTFQQTRADLDDALDKAEALGLDEQSRRATRSLGIARMEALFNATATSLRDAAAQSDPAQIQGLINAFSISFDPLLNGAITEERRARDQAISEISVLRRRLTQAALAVVGATALMLASFYVGLVRPQMSRLDTLRDAAHEIGKENFQIALPDRNTDEIGQVFKATNLMAAGLAARKAKVDDDWGRLTALVDARTEELRAANETLAKTDEDRRRFFADVSHELRTPLTVILMESELALKDGTQSQEAFETIHLRANRLSKRIDDLLRIARSESGLLSLDASPFDLDDVTSEAVEDMISPLENAGLALEYHATKGVEVIGDANWTRQVISGLLENCIRHALAGGSVCVEVADGSVRVIDNGPGIGVEDHSRVLKRFQQSRSGGKAGGFGIGLSLARWIIEQQGGRIDLVSPVPDTARLGTEPGTMVTVFFPNAAG